MKRVLFLADCGSPHTRKWADALAGRGLSIGIFSIGKGNTDEWWKNAANITVFNEHALSNNVFSSRVLSKLGYLRLLPSLKKAIKEFAPDLVHAHYATSYGLLGRLSGFHPFIISAWGSDVMDFPGRSIFHKALLKSNLQKADAVLATSPTIERYIHAVIKKEVSITPFGIDTAQFCPQEIKDPIFEKTACVVGTVKSLEPVYRIDLLLESFARAAADISKLRLLIVGGGTLEQELKQLSISLGIHERVHFAGKISMDQAAAYHNMIDIFVNVPEYESFGVSVLEASACARPVIVSSVGGLKDVVKQDLTGLFIEPGDVSALTESIKALASDEQKRKMLGDAGRKFVQAHYELSACVDSMISIYEKVLKQKR